MDGKPKPHIMWLINGRNLNINNGKSLNKFLKILVFFSPFNYLDHYELIDDNRILIINSVNLNDNARYTCIGTNIAGELSNHIDLQIFSKIIIC